MASRKSYNRFFIILQEDQKGYGVDTSKTPSGYAKLETMNDKAKTSFYVQNLRKQKGPYNMVLIVQGKNGRELINLGSINIDDLGRADISNDYSSDNIANTHISMDKVEGAAICRMSDDKVVPVMVGFSGGEELKNWFNFPVASCAERNDKIYAMPLRKEDAAKAKAKNKTYETEIKVVKDRADDKAASVEKKPNANNVADNLKNEMDKINQLKEELKKEKEQLEADKAALKEEQDKLLKDNQLLESIKQEKEKLEADLNNLQADKEKLEEDKNNLQAEKEKLEADKNTLQADRDKLSADIEAFNKEKEAFIKEKEAFMKEKKECEELKKSMGTSGTGSNKSKCGICKYIKIKRDNGEEEYVPVDDEVEEPAEGQSFDDYEREIEEYKEQRSKKCKDKKYDNKKYKGKDKDDDNDGKDGKKDEYKWKDGKCKTYPKEHKEEFFNSVVEGLEKLGENENIKNCKWYKADVDKLESMYCVYDYNKYAVIFYPMICYYPYIAKSKEFRVGYKYDDDEKLRYIIYAIPGTKDLKDQPYEGKTGFVTFMPESNDESRGYWLMYYDIDENTVVVPIMK